MTKAKTRNHKSGRDVLSQTEKKKSPRNSVPPTTKGTHVSSLLSGYKSLGDEDTKVSKSRGSGLVGSYRHNQAA